MPCRDAQLRISTPTFQVTQSMILRSLDAKKDGVIVRKNPDEPDVQITK